MAYGINEINQASQSVAQSTEQLGQSAQGAMNAVEIERQKQNQKDFLKMENVAYENIVSTYNENPDDPEALDRVIKENINLIENEESLNAGVRQKLKQRIDKISFPYKQRASVAFKENEKQQERDLINQSAANKEKQMLDIAYSGGDYNEELSDYFELQKTRLNNGDISEQEFDNIIKNQENNNKISFYNGEVDRLMLSVDDDIKTQEELNKTINSFDEMIKEVDKDNSLNEQQKNKLKLTLRGKVSKFRNFKTAEFKELEDRFTRTLNNYKTNAELGYGVNPEVEQEIMGMSFKLNRQDEVEEIAEKRDFATKPIPEQNAVIQELLSSDDSESFNKGVEFNKLSQKQRELLKEDPIAHFQRQGKTITTYEDSTELFTNSRKLEQRLLEIEELKETENLNDLPFFSKNEVSVFTRQISSVMQQGEKGIEYGLKIISNLADNNLLNSNVMNNLSEVNPDIAKLSYQYNRLIGDREFASMQPEVYEKKKDFLSQQVIGKQKSKEIFKGNKVDSGIQENLNDYFADEDLHNGSFTQINEFKDASNMIKNQYSFLLDQKFGSGQEIDNDVLSGEEFDEELLNQARDTVLDTLTIRVKNSVILKPHGNFKFNGGDFITHLRNEDPSYISENSIKTADDYYSIELPKNFHKTKSTGDSPFNANELADKVESGEYSIRTIHSPTSNQVGYQFINSDGEAIGERGGTVFTYYPSPIKKVVKNNNNTNDNNFINDSVNNSFKNLN